VTFRSALVPPYVRRTKTLEAALPWLYLKGISSGEMAPALKVLLGPEAKGLSANTVSRLKRDWAKEYDGWREAELGDEPLVYIWVDGVHSGLRGENDKLCALVIVGVTARGKKRFLAIEDGVRESTQSWREVLLNLKSRGMNAPKLAIGDGAMGFWAAMDEIYPATRHQRCWQHKMMNILNFLPKLSQPKAKAAIHNISFSGHCLRNTLSGNGTGRDQRRCGKGVRFVHRDLRTQISQGSAVPAKGPRRTHDILRLPSSALAEHPHQQPN
jgi:putative transposase